jgi:hypothetical protein
VRDRALEQPLIDALANEIFVRPVGQPVGELPSFVVDESPQVVRKLISSATHTDLLHPAITRRA